MLFKTNNSCYGDRGILEKSIIGTRKEPEPIYLLAKVL
jgi:hypothetical protein